MSIPVTTAMVDRFLSWKLPEDFGPDAGISFDRSNVAKWGMPIGTNLFTATQAKAMLEHVLGAEPAASVTGLGFKVVLDERVPDGFVAVENGSEKLLVQCSPTAPSAVAGGVDEREEAARWHDAQRDFHMDRSKGYHPQAEYRVHLEKLARYHDLAARALRQPAHPAASGVTEERVCDGVQAVSNYLLQRQIVPPPVEVLDGMVRAALAAALVKSA